MYKNKIGEVYKSDLDDIDLPMFINIDIILKL